jgi:hypothetical protein
VTPIVVLNVRTGRHTVMLVNKKLMKKNRVDIVVHPRERLVVRHNFAADPP